MTILFEALLALAEEERGRREFSAALARLDVVEGCRPTENFRRQARYLRGMVSLRRGDLDRARDGFEGLLADAPGDYRTLIALGYLAVLADKVEEARGHYGRALGLIEEELLGEMESGQELRLTRMLAVAERAVESVR